MVDVMLMQALLRAVPNGAALPVVGDVDQLPSVEQAYAEFLRTVAEEGMRASVDETVQSNIAPFRRPD
jgi:ATP-dependent exoDNAse (exonuclease V) alpha subunit